MRITNFRVNITHESLHAAHKVYKIQYHIVICVKYRNDMFLSREKIEYFEKSDYSNF